MQRWLFCLMLALSAGAACAADAPAKRMPLLASDLLEMPVRNANNDWFGAISDLLVDSRGGIAFVVLRIGGVLGMGDRRYVVPWDRLQFEAGQKSVLLDLSPDRLAMEFPAFDTRLSGAGGAGGKGRQ